MREIIQPYLIRLEAKLNDLGIENSIRFSGEPIEGLNDGVTVVDVLPINYGRTLRKFEDRGQYILTWYEGDFDLTFHYLSDDIGIEEKIERAVISELGERGDRREFFGDGLDFRYRSGVWGHNVMNMTVNVKFEYVKRDLKEPVPIATGVNIDGIGV